MDNRITTGPDITDAGFTDDMCCKKCGGTKPSCCTCPPTIAAEEIAKWITTLKRPLTSETDQRLAEGVVNSIISKHPTTEVADLPSGWRPIESAPKDGTEIILACFGWVMSVPVTWVMNTYWLPACVGSPLLERTDVHCVCCPDDPNYTGEWKNWKMYCAYKPSHWMPLPAPPVTDEEKGDQNAEG